MTRGRPHNVRTLLTVAFGGAVVVVVLAQLWVIGNGIFVLRLWEDEAFNLTVPLNILRGFGYTSDGTLSGSELTMFDPRISTGPVVLLPITVVLAFGADPVIGARSVIAIFYIALLAGLWVLGSRLGGRWAGLVAILVPLGWNTWSSGSPIQSPVDVLGEVPASALLVWSLIVAKRRPWLAGLLIGLAMQSKLLAALAAPAVAVVILLMTAGAFWRRARRVLICALVAAVPTAANEAWKLIVLGPAQYVDNLREFYWFFKTGGQNISPVPPTTKLSAIIEGWASPVWLTVIGAISVAILLGIVFVRARGVTDEERSTGRWGERDAAALGAAAIVGLVIWLGWWVVSTHTPNWPRYPAIAFYVFSPLLVALALRQCTTWWNGGRGTARRGRTAASVAVVMLVVAPIVVQTVMHVQHAPRSRVDMDLAAQKSVAARIGEFGAETLVSPWGAEVSIVVLSGAHAALDDVPRLAGTPQLIRDYGSASRDGVDFDTYLSERCTDVPVRAGAYALCLPRE